MLILIEGMDNTGKTTLASKLGELLPSFKYYHHVKPHNRKEAMDNFSQILRESISTDLICDRLSTFSEPVYGTILRGQPLLSDEDVNYMLDILVDSATVIIFCNPPIEAVLKTIGVRDQMEGVEENCKKLYEAYQKLFGGKLNDDDYIVYDYTDKDRSNGVIELILGAVKEIKETMNGRK